MLADLHTKIQLAVSEEFGNNHQNRKFLYNIRFSKTLYGVDEEPNSNFDCFLLK